jgi:UDP-N-acetylmuramate--alanine ligase
VFDFVGPDIRISDIKLGVPVSINVENGVAAIAIAYLNGVTAQEIKAGMESFRGVDRRFDFKLKTADIALLTDYAHHPSEIEQSMRSIRELYAGKKLTVLFQPHLYSRTHDFYRDFARSLSLADEVILTEIYPAREQPMPGVTSALIYDNLADNVEKTLCRKSEVVELLKSRKIEVLVVLGAGDVDALVPAIQKELESRLK